MEQKILPPTIVLRRMIDGYRVTQAIHVVVKLGIADLLSSGPRNSDDLAAATRSDPDSLYRVLRALAGLGVFREDPMRNFALTDLGTCLRSEAPDSLAGWAAFVGEPYHGQAWGDLEHNVRTGENAFRHIHGTDPWTFRSRHPELSAGFDRAMTDLARQAGAAVLASFSFAGFETIVDVGGGNGTLLAAILTKYPSAHGILFDQPHVVAGAPPVLAAARVADRCDVVGGSFFATVPSRGDAYVLKSILHDWEDEDCVRILERCRQAMRDGAVLLVVERELGPANAHPDAKFSDLNMLTGPGGRERTPEEYARLFAAAGLRYDGFTPSTIGTGVFQASAA